MFDRKFLNTALGRAALVSALAMVAFNVLALTGQLHAAPIHGQLLLVQTA